METQLRIEADAAEVYTLEIYYRVREEIKSACYRTSMLDMSRDNESRHFKCKDEMLHGKLFEVSVRLSDNDVRCSCKLYFRKGYLFKHSFAVIQQCGIHTIPHKIVKPRWTRNAVKNYSTLGSSETPLNREKSDKSKLKMTRAWFEFNICMNYAGDGEENLDTIMTDLQKISNKMQKKVDPDETLGQSKKADKFVGPIPHTDEFIQNPLQSQNKGCGTRIKSSKEISMQTRKPRTCSTCNKIEVHNSRTCPLSKKSRIDDLD